jgi:RHS repeat-associated protein
MKVSVFLTDHAGTPHRLVDREGKTIWEAEPDDWGAVKNEKGVRQPIRFQGQWLDEESGFYYNRNRYYDPKQGRYITQDPIGLAGGVNNFIYPANPVGWVDPLGLWTDFGNVFVPNNLDTSNRVYAAQTGQPLSHQTNPAASVYVGAGGVVGPLGATIDIGLTAADRTGSWLPRLCAFAAVNVIGGWGMGGGAYAGVSGSNSSPPPGFDHSTSIGGTVSGGFMGDYSASTSFDPGQPTNVTAGATLGIGGGVYAGATYGHQVNICTPW